MRIAHVSCYVDPLGRSPATLVEAWPTLSAVAGAAARAGPSVVVVQAASTDAEVFAGVPVRFVRERNGGLRARSLGLWASPPPKRMTRALQELKPDLIHFHSLSFPLHVRYLRRRLQRVPMLVQDHADGPFRGLRGRLQRWGLEGVAAVAFTSAEQAAPFVGAGVLARDTPVFEILESSSHFTPGDQTAARKATGLHGGPVLLWVGRLDANKDPLTVFEAVKRVAPVLPDVQLWCCFTAAPLADRINRWLAAEPEAAGRIHLEGAVPHEAIEEYYRAADFLISASRSEGSGYAVLEAMACGTPPLVTDIPSFRRMTGNGAVGVLSPPGDAAAMARSIASAVECDPLQRRAAVRAHFDNHLSFEVIGSALRSAYETILGAA